MYVTRRLSELRKSPDSVSKVTDGPNSGYLVIQDEESETYSFFGLVKNHDLKDLPFPQNKNLSVVHGNGVDNDTSYTDVVLIPVLNLPLSANRYYAIQPHGKHKGEAFTCSREADMTNCCFFPSIKDVKPMPFDVRNIYQQIKIADYVACNIVGKGYYHAKSIAADGFPPLFLRRKGWRIRIKTPKHYTLSEAPGLDAALRVRFPEFAFPLSLKRSETVIVGKWYCPFMFINEGTLKYQMETSMFYKIALEQRWEQIYACTNNDVSSKLGNVAVDIDVAIDKEIAYVAGGKAKWNDDKDHIVDGKIMFRVGEEASVGLSVELVQRMKWEQARGGFSYDGGVKRQERVKRVENFEGIGQWEEFACYVLVESFVITRLDGTVVIVYEFWHTHQLRTKWL